eukprot:TRINITY_DN5993_c0_g1_i1.p1 TRINITY_DN5993_c0_g1~~TRINITY_DN5993_c0_g1_i1.p1  ORF type:complete len:619 (+),score=144.99 TRINITY_DN5993_c0_g1_i1:238-2094(+)
MTKVQVSIEFRADGKAAAPLVAPKSLKLAVKASDSVENVRQRILMVEPIPFPNQEFQLDGAKLDNQLKFGDLELEDGQNLCLVVKASEDILVKQIGELVKARPLTSTELGLLYCHQNGAKMNEALSILGLKEQLTDFVRRQKKFTVDKNSGLISLTSDVAKEPVKKKGLETIKEFVEESQVDTCQSFGVKVAVSLKTTFGNDAYEEIDLQVTSAQTVQSVSQRALDASLIPFVPEEIVFQGKKLGFGQKLVDTGVCEGSYLHLEVFASQMTLAGQLAELLEGRSLSSTELSNLYCYRFGVPTSRALKILGLQENLKDFIERQSFFELEHGLVCLAEHIPSDQSQASSILNDKYLKLNKKISKCPSIQKASDALDLVTKTVCDGGLIQVRRVVRMGSIGRGTACIGCTDAKAMLIIDGMPILGRSHWGPPLLRAVALMLRAALCAAPCTVEEVVVKYGRVHVQFEGDMTIELELEATDSPDAILAERRARFFEKQEQSSKVTMKLLKCWRNRQRWKDADSMPSDLLLETLTAYSMSRSVPSDQVEAVQQVMSLLVDFRKLHVTWPEYLRSYLQDDVPHTVLIERPLIMDPVDPGTNMQYAEEFNYRQLEELAKNFSGLF